MLELFSMRNDYTVDPNDLYGEPTGLERRPAIVKEILEAGDKIKHKSTDILCGDNGDRDVSYLLGMLAYNSSPDVKGYEWMSKEREPLLDEIMDDLSPIDVDNNNPEAWRKLKADIERLRQDELKRKANDQ